MFINLLVRVICVVIDNIKRINLTINTKINTIKEHAKINEKTIYIRISGFKMIREIQLKDLNDMYQSGVLTKEEFEMAKKKALSQ